ncbi:uncharacterized protein M421DRAFT_383060 [Didymella exigua CBS 183.55]|uniref:Uncharacterized protein n=1 Tax=Didymella exigua CBS 183.55 TaxID=1150837 RepID=A0A6A5RSM8_9PLEO|nr:uncharacterized protein M421DRAFT_383060 [Didymella exigua CBS 183.55]KAF1930008.1 hypothetical protein M421DRAFT_383060 [Didymella exigua CBS 183.55]
MVYYNRHSSRIAGLSYHIYTTQSCYRTLIRIEIIVHAIPWKNTEGLLASMNASASITSIAVNPAS